MVGDMVASIYIHFIQCTLVGAESSNQVSREANHSEQGSESGGVARFHWSVSMVPLSLAKKWRSRHRKAFTQRPRWLDDLPPFAPSLAPLPPGKGGQVLPPARGWAPYTDYPPYSLTKDKNDAPPEGLYY